MSIPLPDIGWVAVGLGLCHTFPMQPFRPFALRKLAPTDRGAAPACWPSVLICSLGFSLRLQGLIHDSLDHDEMSMVLTAESIPERGYPGAQH